MNWYYTVEKELSHVRNAIQVLDVGRGQFPAGLEVCEPRYGDKMISNCDRFAVVATNT